MKHIEIIHIGKKWKTYPKKIKQLQDWFKNVADFSFSVHEIPEKKLPFVQVGKNDFCVDNAWLLNNIALEKNTHAVMVSIPKKLWKGKDLRGFIQYGTPHIIQIGSDDTALYEYNGKKHPGGRWFNIARHEITHMLYRDKKLTDNTHLWWELGKLEKTIDDLTEKKVPLIPDHVKLAIQQIGVKEFEGKLNNPIILQWAKECNINYVEDETAWCSLFINWIAMKSGLPFSGKLNARSWLDIGKKVSTPKLGDVVVFWRENKDSWKGHVGLYISDNGKNVLVLGANQNDSVSIAEYPVSRVLGYRRLK